MSDLTTQEAEALASVAHNRAVNFQQMVDQYEREGNVDRAEHYQEKVTFWHTIAAKLWGNT